MYRQVSLQYETETGYVELVCWIDNAVARKGAHVRDERGQTWVVAEVYGVKDGALLQRQGETQRDFERVLDS